MLGDTCLAVLLVATAGATAVLAAKKKYTLEKEITNSRGHPCSSNLEYKSPVELKFHNSI